MKNEESNEAVGKEDGIEWLKQANQSNGIDTKKSPRTLFLKIHQR